VNSSKKVNALKIISDNSEPTKALRLLNLSLAATLAVILITAVCGWLFNCGCTWPWYGFVKHCNAFVPSSPEKCPWCTEGFIRLMDYFHS
jgi:hypothetical protein